MSPLLLYKIYQNHVLLNMDTTFSLKACKQDKVTCVNSPCE